MEPTCHHPEADATQAVGASGGLRILYDWVPAWTAAFSVPAISVLLPFARSLMSPPGGAPVACLFGTLLLGAVGRALLADDDMTGFTAASADVLPLLLDTCTALRPAVSASPLGRQYLGPENLNPKYDGLCRALAVPQPVF